jgi:hypothetical protein
MMSPELEQLKEDMSKLAERIAFEGFGIKLDYSIESIKQVDKVLGELHKAYKKTRDDEGFTGIAFEFTAYIVKVIENNFGPVRWEHDHPEMGPDSFPLYLDEGALFPFGWCYKRLYDGPSDDIWTKFCFFVLKIDPQPELKKGFIGRLFGK